MTRYVPTIDAASCILSGECEELCPAVFRTNDYQAAMIGTANDELVLVAAKECPTEAIIVTDSVTGEQVYPEGASLS